MIGVGVGVGFGGQGLSPAWLVSRLSTRFGARILNLSLGSDLVLTGANVTGWTPRIGTAIVPTNTTYFGASVANGRQGIYSATVQDKGWKYGADPGANTNTLIVVSTCPALPAAGNQCLAFKNGVAAHQISNGASAFDSTPYQELTDGASTLSPGTAGAVHSYEWSNLNSAYTALEIFGAYAGAGSMSWTGVGSVVLLLSDNMTAGERSATHTDLVRFSRI